jgi:hypothetical protein
MRYKSSRYRLTVSTGAPHDTAHRGGSASTPAARHREPLDENSRLSRERIQGLQEDRIPGRTLDRRGISVCLSGMPCRNQSLARGMRLVDIGRKSRRSGPRLPTTALCACAW